MRKTTAAVAATTATLALALAACSGGGGNEGGTGDDGGEAPAGPIAFYTDKAAWEPSFDAMNEASGDLTLEFTGYSDAAAYDAFIKQAFRTDAPPALFTWHTGDSLAELVEEGLVAETTELWDAAIENGDVPEDLAADYTYDGKQYCVPLNIAYWVMYYNKAIFEENGIEVPTTWDELIAAADTLVAAGVIPFHQMNIIFEFVWFQANLLGLDPEAYQGLSTGDTSYTDPVVVEAMENWQSMMADGYFIDPGVQTDPQTLLSTGEVAMAYFGTFFTGQLTAIDQVSGEDYGIFPMPSVDDGVGPQMVVETGPLCAAAAGPDVDAALDYSAWWMTADAQQAWADERGEISFNPAVTIEDPELSAITDAVGAGDFQLQQRYLEATPAPIYTVSASVFGDFVTNYPDDVMPALEQIQAEADSYWASE
ncbi:extracellular solute-binding protein family 1 [Beutenbergia cavernae DSM 12333]|uniref:Extracellular solute-binding protein family 1 n=1 Tax=Beutenbergia cavernae (strain ATCC BAA-8 / DSM 12333 / CCUG 43141 / JCM 11478 / NBRC 16432 / NCIMB 13614 / HKI 0122) TaxID=471853 RepID=C5BY48_BEUC1|nr:extracellular solute-binding protein [Beutenbergia cavernae]ACQ80948.1 extracellular solute-binding protein family 1 [Beutenbergia cavernae DSM 12333]